MKTQVIQLEPHDDVVSVRDKLSWAKTERIIIVFPRQTSLHDRPLDLRLLKRHAASLGAMLAIVTRSVELRLVARELDIPVFSTLSAAKKSRWQPGVLPPPETLRRGPPPDLRRMRRETFPPERTSWTDRFGWRLGFFSLGVVAILAMLLVFAPSATIQISPATRLQYLTLPVSASVHTTAITPGGGLPARTTNTIVEQSKTVRATGSVSIPDKPATGSVTFRNLTTAAVSIPAGTVVSTQAEIPVRFATLSAADLEAGVGKTVDVPVRAVEAGSAGNLEADTLVAIQADLGAGLSITNPRAMTGGTDRTASIQTTADRTALRLALLADILNYCKTSLQGSLAAGDTFFPGSLSVSQTLSEAYFPAEGQSGDTLSLTLRVQCEAQYAASTDVTILAKMLEAAEQPKGFDPVSGGLVVQPSSEPVTDTQGVTRWSIKAQSLLQARLDPQAVYQISLGHRPAAVAQQLSDSLPLAAAPLISIRPSWWPWLPLIPFNITVTIGG